MKIWLYLVGAVFAEVVWAISLKESQNFTRLWPTIISIISLAGDFFFLAYTFKYLPISVVYPMWVGLGALGICLYGFTVYSEPVTILKIACIALIVVGVVGLKVLAPAE